MEKSKLISELQAGPYAFVANRHPEGVTFMFMENGNQLITMNVEMARFFSAAVDAVFKREGISR